MKPPNHRVPLSELMVRLAANATIKGREAPVIETDFESAKLFAILLAQDIGAPLRDLVPAAAMLGRADCLIQFDGVKIVARPVDICKQEVDGWREHFGPLADIWS